MQRLISFITILSLLCCMRADAQMLTAIVGAVRKPPCTTSVFTGVATYLWLPTSNAGGTGNAGMTDPIGSNTASTSTAGYTYSASDSHLNGQPALVYPGSSYSILTLATPIPSTVTSYTFGVIAYNLGSNGEYPLTIGGVGYGAMQYGPWSNHPTLGGSYLGTIASDSSTTLSTPQIYAIAATYTPGTGAYAFYKCSSGACSNTASGTNSVAISSSITGLLNNTQGALNADVGVLFFYNGSLTQAQLTASLGAYSYACMAN